MNHLSTEQAKTLQEMLEDLASEQDHLALLQSLLVEDNKDAFGEIAAYFSAMQTLQKKVEELQAKVKKGNGDLVDELAKVGKGIERKVEDVKNYCHNLPEEALQESFVFDQGRVKVKVSSTRFSVSYRTEELLEDHPELEEIYVDGDPVVGRVVYPDVLERLIASGEVKIKNLERYRIAVKERSPSVSVQFKGLGDE